MRYFSFAIISLFMNACQGTAAPFFQDADDILTNEVCCVEVKKGAMKASTDVDISVSIKNKDAVVSTK